MKQALELRCAVMLSMGPLLAAGPAAFAQDQVSSTSTPKQETDGPALEEIVVTADRAGYGADLVQAGSFRGARQLDTPLTISVIPKALLETQQATSLHDALRNTAGVTAAQTSPTVYNNLSIRGIEVENRGNYRLDGTLPIVNLTDLPIEDKERVEALKGASALYYGFTTPSGIINLTMKRPTQSPLFSTRVFGNSHGALGAHVDVGGTYGMFGYRLNGVYAQPDSGIDHTDGTRKLFAGAFDIRPTDNLTIQIDAEHTFKEVNEPGIYRFLRVPTPTPENPYPVIPLPALTDAETNFGPDWAWNQTEATNLLGTVNWKFNQAWALSVSAGLAELERERHFNTLDPNDPNTNPLNGPLGEYAQAISYQPLAKYKNTNYRAELAGAFNTGPFEHEILIGASQNTRSNRSSVQRAQRCLYDATTGALVGATFATTAPAGQRNAVCRQSINAPHDIPQLEEPAVSFNNPTEIEDLGYYVFDRVKFGEWLQLLGGVRRSDYTETNLLTGAELFHATPTSVSYGAVVKPRDWISIYGTYIEGLESTPAAGATAVNAFEQLPPSESKQYEGGVKVELKDGLLLQVAYFDIERDSAVINGANVYVKDGRSVYKGTELSLTGEITSDLSIYASALFLDAEYESGQPTGFYPNSSGALTFVPTIVGNRIENTPEETYSVAGEYRFSNLLPGFSLNAAAYYVGDRAINSLNQNFAPSYTLFDLGAAYTTEFGGGQRLTVRINGENITGEEYWVSTGALLLAQGAPSTVKFSIETSF
jgi:iron complex outermembrane receptor protein